VAAISEQLFESTMFGHVRGAFSGAIGSVAGILAEADGGTCFMDEVGSLPLDVQCKLLRALDDGEFRPIGARCDQRSDFRLVSAANESLGQLVECGSSAGIWHFGSAVL
jgi:sigma-54-specific transcriptional regulator